MKTRIKLFVTSLLLSAFYFSSNAQVTIDVGKDIYVCTGDSVVLPRVRVVTPSCIDSSLINECLIYILPVAPNCGCDQIQYFHPSPQDIAGTTSFTPGLCPSQISNWSGGNGGVFSNSNTQGLFNLANNTIYHPTIADYAQGYSLLVFTQSGQTDTLKVIYTSGVELGLDRLICTPLSNIQLSALISGGNNGDIWAGWTGGLGVFSPNNIVSNPTYTPTSAEISNGLVNLIYTDSKLTGSCKSDTLTIFLNNSISSSVTVDAGNTISTCGSSLPLSLTATGSNINQLTWYGHGTFSSSNTLSTSYSLSNDEIQTGYGSVAVIATDQNNCSITDTLNFNIKTRVDILNDNINNLYTTDKKEVIICATAGSTYNLSGIVKGISNNVTWTTNGSGSFLNPNSTSTIYSFSSQDIQNNIVTVYFQSNGCNNPKDSLKIKINNITANLNFGNLPFFGTCNTTYSFPVNFSGVTYVWGNYCLLGNTTVTLDNNPITPDPNTGLYAIGPLSAGLHQIEVYGGACNNLIGSHSINISAGSGIIGIQDTSVCEGEFVTLYGQGGSNYVWSGGILNGVPFLPPGPGVYTYNLTGIDNCGVLGYDTITVMVQSSNSFFQIFNSTLCSGPNSDPIQFFSNNNNYITYYWDYGFQSGINVQPSSDNFLIPNGGPHVDSIQYIATNTTNQPQTITLHINYGNFGGCGNTIQQQFVLLPEENVNAGPDLTICPGTSVTLNGSGSSVVNYSWNNNVQNGISFIPTTSTIYTLTGTQPFGGCTYTDQVTVTVNPNPIVDAGPNQSVCAGNSVTLNGSGANTYSWDNGVTNGISLIPTATTTFNVTGTNTTTGCIGTDQVLVTVNPIPIVDAGPNQSICAGNSVTLNGSGANTYSWDNGVTNGISFIPNFTLSYTVTGINTSSGCIGTDQVTIIVKPLPSVTITSTPLTLSGIVCEGDSYQLVATGNPSGGTYSWDPGNQTTSQITISTNIGQSGTQTNSVIYTFNGCSSPAINQDVQVLPLPIVNVPDYSTCNDDTLIIIPNVSPIGGTYLWSNGSTSNQISIIGGVISENYQLSYTVNGCTNSDIGEILINPNTYSTINEISIGNYTWPVNGQTYSEDGIYTGIIPNQYGCDSIITLNLTITTGSLEDISKSEHFTLSPNPNNGQFTVNVGSSLIGKSFKLMTTDGKIIRQDIVLSENFEITIQNQISTGVYFLEIGNNIKRLVINDK
jgi:hypothetical protein